VQHWLLSWRQGEHPGAAQSDEAVRIFLDELGLADHQWIYALHRNTDNSHLHLAINRVHPETERVVTVNGGFDIEVAHRSIARIEHVQGQREAGGRRREILVGDWKGRAAAFNALRSPSWLRGRPRRRPLRENATARSWQPGASGSRAGLRARDIRSFSAQIHGWEVRYRRVGAPAFSDRGREIRIHDLGRDSVLAALQLSAQKWGTFQIYGSNVTRPRAA
jgi:hypothetical protein